MEKTIQKKKMNEAKDKICLEIINCTVKSVNKSQVFVSQS